MSDKEKAAEEFAETDIPRNHCNTEAYAKDCFLAGADWMLGHLRGRLEPVDFDEISDKDVESLALQIQALKERIKELESSLAEK